MFKRLFLAFTSTLLVLLVLLYSVVFYYLSTSMQQDLILSQEATISSYKTAFDASIQQVQNFLLSTAIDEDFQEELLAFYHSDFPLAQLNITQPATSDSSLIAHLYVYPMDAEQTLYTLDDSGTYQISGYTYSDFSKQLTVQPYTSDQGSYIRLAQPVLDTSTWNHKLAILVADISVDTLSAQLNFSNFSKSGSILLMDESNSVVYPYVPSKDLDLDTILTTFQEGTVITSNQVIMSRSLGLSQWHLVTYSDADLFRQGTIDLMEFILTAGIAITLLSILISLGITYQTTRPLHALIVHMHKDGFMSTIHCPRHVPNEIRLLYSNYNDMVLKNNQHIEDIYLLSNREKEVELKMLQSQINPHFLYNVLDSINWLAIKHQVHDISAMVTSLADMLRNSLNRGRRSLPIEQELSIVKNYLFMQEYRYNGTFSVQYDIDASVLNKKVISLIIQPLVENAILHGIDTREQGGGVLIISVYPLDNDIMLTVKNNGALPDIPRMERILNGQDTVTNSYGIKNIHARIRTAFGEPYGLSYSIDGEWCVATIRIPACDTL